MRALPLLLLLIACVPAGDGPAHSFRDDAVPIASKADFDAARFAGRWHRVARFPDPAAKGCAGAVVEYGPPRNGVSSLRTFCEDASGTVSDVETGVARAVGLGRLVVSMDAAPAPSSQWVLWTDQSYRTAVLGTPDGSAGWILNRTASFPYDRQNAALEVLNFNGFRTEHLVWSSNDQSVLKKTNR